MQKAAVVVAGTSVFESLGAMKLERYLSRLGYRVDRITKLTMFDDYDFYAFSAVFSWHLPRMVGMVREAIRRGVSCWIGGPAVSFAAANRAYVLRQTGVSPHVGIDERFEQEPGDYPMVYFSRGCPAYTPACGFCPVPKLEGTSFRFYPDATPAPLLLDNNLSALPIDYQNHIIRRYQGFPGKVDANSGFEPHSFDEDTCKRWEDFPLRYWRFGYDDITERDQAGRMMTILARRGYSGDRVRVYTLIGNEPIATCLRRIREVIAKGFHPWPQRLRPLDWLGGALPTRHDWDEATLIAVQRFYSLKTLWGRIDPRDFYYQGRFPFRDIQFS
jgi:hypothetical protein